MKYWFYFFAILDLISIRQLILNYRHFLDDLNIFKIIQLFLYMSFIISASLLFEKKRLGLLINFVQFPIRLIMAVFSFSFVSSVFVKFFNYKESSFYFFIVLMIIEIVRLILEIFLFKKLKNVPK